jgi:hypothetical protein
MPMPLRLALFLALLLCAGAAQAGGDVCLVDDTNDEAFVLKNLRVPKKPGDSVLVSGFGLNAVSATSLPLDGTLVRDLDSDLLLGLTRHFSRCLIGFVLDANLTGTVFYDCNLDNVNDTSAAVGRVDCGELLDPP